MLFQHHEIKAALAGLIEANRAQADRRAQDDAAASARKHAAELYGLRAHPRLLHHGLQDHLADAIRKTLAIRDAISDPAQRDKAQAEVARLSKIAASLR